MFVEITEKEFWDVLLTGKDPPAVLQENGDNKQLIVGWRVTDSIGANTPYLVKVYTTIHGKPGKGITASSGRDSMRICLVNVETNEVIGKAAYNKLMRGWARRLKEKVALMFEYAKEDQEFRQANGLTGTSPRCPKCSSTMKLRSSQTCNFWGCSNFPKCRQTQDVQPRIRPVPDSCSFEEANAIRLQTAPWNL